MGNIVAFPKPKKNVPLQSIEQIIENVEAARRDSIEYIIDEFMAPLFGISADNGFDLSQDECLKSTSFFIESFRAALYKTVGLEHSLHRVADELMKLDEDEEETSE